MADKKGSHSKRKHSSSSSSSAGSNLATARRVRETPYQDITRIRRNILAIKEAKGSLSPEDYFKDPSFTSDMTSLAYVYSGDDKYEKAIFKRPHEFQQEPVFVGVGGVCDEPFPWRQWKQRHWLHAALVTVSLSIRHLEKIIPGYKNFEQGFVNDYTGAFHFNIWRFGEWIDIIVDDRLPMLDDHHLFCGPMGSAQELWGPLVEKAYAKCKKTYQSIEYGSTLDALTDLTGAVCEHFTPDVRPPRILFRILVKSHMARSQMVCWRNEKRLTTNGFNADSEHQECQNQRYLHVITAVTKFPTTDSRLVEMLRLKCPFSGEPRWLGRFSDRDFSSWESVNRDFRHRFQPLTKKDDDEYWISMEDFRCNFGGLFIISSPEPFRVDGLSLARSYHLQDGWDYTTLASDLTPTSVSATVSPATNRFFRRSSTPRPEDNDGGLLDSDALDLARRRTSHASIFSSAHSGHFHPPRHHHHHHHHMHQARGVAKDLKQVVTNEEESTADTQSLFVKTHALERAKKGECSPGVVTPPEASPKKGGFFSRSANHHQQNKAARRKSNDLQRLAIAQNEAKRSGTSLKNVLQTGLVNMKLSLDCKFDPESDSYESEATDDSPEICNDPIVFGAPVTSPESPQSPNAHPVPYTKGHRSPSATSPTERQPSSPTTKDKAKPVPSPRSATKSPWVSPTSKSTSPRPSHRSPKPQPRSPKYCPRSPKSPAGRLPKSRSPKPPLKDRDTNSSCNTMSPNLVRKMTSSTNVAAVIGNVSSSVTAKQRQARSPKPASRARGSAPVSSLSPPAFKPPKSPKPIGHRNHRAVSPSPQRSGGNQLATPDNLKSPEIFSVTITRDKSSETLSVPGFSPDSQTAEESTFQLQDVPKKFASSSRASSPKPDSLVLGESGRWVEMSDAHSKKPVTSPVTYGDVFLTDATTASSSTDVVNSHVQEQQVHTSPPKSPRPKPSPRTPTESTGISSEDKTSTIAEHFFQPVREKASPSSTTIPEQFDSQTASLLNQPSPQTGAIPTQPDPQSVYRRALRSVSSTSDTDSTHSSSDIFLHFKPGTSPISETAERSGGGGGGGGGSRKHSSGRGEGRGMEGRGREGSITEEMGEEQELEEQDNGFLLPASSAEGRRPHSAPNSNLARHVSSSSLSSLTQGHFRATKADYFRSEGRWRLVLEVYDKWTRAKQCSCRSNLDLHSRSTRHHFHVSRLEHPDEVSPPTLQGKRHVIVSLLQDYRHGANTANSLLVPIGFCVYKCKGTERDDKRHVTRFQLVEQVHGEPEMREVTARLDLDHGSYFLVPFHRSEGHVGEYLLRVLTEDCPQVKAGCRVS
ncbi:hypothetical protein V1264_009695 [Littorina saxatilis]|uniref:Calpain catalytic domain-containing protein n=1 Tax=Littorina saxatilis TaxID=31220 RepID=A0AAN9AT57_9CAEN